MEDILLREIRHLNECLMRILGNIVNNEREAEQTDLACLINTELKNEIGIDLDDIVKHDDIVRLLTEDYNFDCESMATFATILYSYFNVSDNRIKTALAPKILQIFDHMALESDFVTIMQLQIVDDVKKYVSQLPATQSHDDTQHGLRKPRSLSFRTCAAGEGI